MISKSNPDRVFMMDDTMTEFEAYMANMCTKYGIHDEFDVIPLMTEEEQRTAVRLMIDPSGCLAQAS